MKIYITLKPSDQHVGDCKNVDFNELSKIPDASCKYIHANDCCDFILERPTFIKQLVKKLKYGGQIIIEGTDVVNVSFGISRGNLTAEEIQALLYNGRLYCDTMLNTKEYLMNFGLTILLNRITQYKYSITAERPNVKS